MPTETKFTPQQHLSMTLGKMDTDISPDFVYNETDARIGAMLINLDKTPQAFEAFCAYANEKFSGKGHANHLCKTCATELKQEARARRKNSAKIAQNR